MPPRRRKTGGRSARSRETRFPLRSRRIQLGSSIRGCSSRHRSTGSTVRSVHGFSLMCAPWRRRWRFALGHPGGRGARVCLVVGGVSLISHWRSDATVKPRVIGEVSDLRPRRDIRIAMALDDATRSAAADLIEALQPLPARAKAMFGGYCFYVGDKVVGLVCDGRVFIKPSPRDDLLRGWAQLAPAYPGAKDSWQLPVSAVRETPDKVRAVVEHIAAALPDRRRTHRR